MPNSNSRPLPPEFKTLSGAKERVFGLIKGSALSLRKRWKLASIVVILAVPTAIFGWWLFAPEKPELVTVSAKRGDLVQTVEAIGTVISENDLKLRFPVTGVVGKVHVKEGEKVSKGQELANLKNESYQADIGAAYAYLASKQASLNELLEGTRKEDIAIAEAETENKRAVLESAYAALKGAEEKLKKSNEKLAVLKKEADTSLAGYITSSESSSADELTTARTAVLKLEDVFEDNAFRSAANYLRPTQFTMVLNVQESAKLKIGSAFSILEKGFGDFRKTIETLNVAKAAILESSRATKEAYDFIADLPLSQNYSSSSRETHKTTVAAQSTNVQGALSNIDATIKNMQDASAGFDSKIAAEEQNVVSAQTAKNTAEADILTYESSLRAKEAELAKKKAGARKTEIDAARAVVNQAAADLNKAKAKLEDTILRAPIDGTITKVNLKEGEFTGGLDLNEFALSMLGASPYRLEMFIAEIDIPKVEYTQTGSVKLDAFPGNPFTIVVSEIDPVATGVDGVPKYRVKLDFTGRTEELKIGMTGDSEIFTDFRKDVIFIPGRAVVETGSGAIVRVLNPDGEIEKHHVVSGMEGEGGDTEIIEGVNEGETVILLIKD